MFKKKVQKTIISNIEPDVMTKQMEQDYTETPGSKGSTRSKNKENKYAYISIKEQKLNEKPKSKRKKKKLEIAAQKEKKLLKKQLKKNKKIKTVKEEHQIIEQIKKTEIPIEENREIKRQEIPVVLNEQIKTQEIPVEIIEEIGVPQVSKKDLSEFFEENKRGNRKLFRKDYKRLKNRQKKKERKPFNDFQDIKNRKAYTYRKKRYENVEDFILFLNDNYLNIDRIAKEVMDDENFYGWISEKSGVFDFSIMEFKDIKEKIEKN